jgi:hypothetical protein
LRADGTVGNIQEQIAERKLVSLYIEGPEGKTVLAASGWVTGVYEYR